LLQFIAINICSTILLSVYAFHIVSNNGGFQAETPMLKLLTLANTDK